MIRLMRLHERKEQLKVLETRKRELAEWLRRRNYMLWRQVRVLDAKLDARIAALLLWDLREPHQRNNEQRSEEPNVWPGSPEVVLERIQQKEALFERQQRQMLWQLGLELEWVREGLREVRATVQAFLARQELQRGLGRRLRVMWHHQHQAEALDFVLQEHPEL